MNIQERHLIGLRGGKRENMNEEIRNAIDLLRKNNYIVIKITEQMIKDYMDCNDVNKDTHKNCPDCSCKFCIM